MGSKNGSRISRREFARRAALVSAAASLSPSGLLNNSATAAVAAEATPQADKGPKLSPESQTEMESRLQAIFEQYGSRLNDAQKADLRRLTAEGQAALDRLRAYSTENGDSPALYLKPLIEHERKTSPLPPIPPGAPKNS